MLVSKCSLREENSRAGVPPGKSKGRKTACLTTSGDCKGFNTVQAGVVCAGKSALPGQLCTLVACGPGHLREYAQNNKGLAGGLWKWEVLEW